MQYILECKIVLFRLFCIGSWIVIPEKGVIQDGFSKKFSFSDCRIFSKQDFNAGTIDKIFQMFNKCAF